MEIAHTSFLTLTQFLRLVSFLQKFGSNYLPVMKLTLIIGIPRFSYGPPGFECWLALNSEEESKRQKHQNLH
tara:strand:+ start:388 stop:603 length:216 start_codon:yes stop_codon:yes gene_type:complete